MQPEQRSVRRFVLTGAPGSGKTSVLVALHNRGYAVVHEAATAVIGAAQEAGDEEPWIRPVFIDQIVALQRQRQLETRAGSRLQLYDRSPICTLALARFLGHPVSAALSAEMDRVARERVYERRVFFLRDIGFCTPTAARRISFADSLKFERSHEHAYRSLGYQLVDVPRDDIAARADRIEAYLASWT